MKLIDEKEVEEAAKLFERYDGLQIWSENNNSGCALCIKSFEKGASFAEQKLLPMMVEFTDFCNKNYYITVHPILPYTWVDLDWEKCFTTEQLLEQFLKTK